MGTIPKTKAEYHNHYAFSGIAAAFMVNMQSRPYFHLNRELTLAVIFLILSVIIDVLHQFYGMKKLLDFERSGSYDADGFRKPEPDFKDLPFRILFILKKALLIGGFAIIIYDLIKGVI